MYRSLLLAALLLLLRATVPAAAPAGFSESVFLNNPAISQATGLAWAPDNSNRLFIIRKDGLVRVVQNGSAPTTFATIAPVFTAGECGLIGFCFDPDFLNNRYIYFFVTVSSTEQQIIRLTDNGEVGTDRAVLVSGLPTRGANHDGGAIGIGPDGHLYWAIGDLGNGTGVDADLTSLAAKVGRVNRFTGEPLADNPFNDGVGPNNEFIWARGFRNPFTMTFHPRNGSLWLNVVGDSYEQIFVPTRGSHGGYNDYENNQPAGFLAPSIVYRTNGVDTRTLATGGAVRAGGVVTFTTTGNHGFRPGARITISGVTDASFNGVVYVRQRISNTQFDVEQDGPDAPSGGGTATTTAHGGSVTGGTFYESTLFPPEYQGNFFFGDFNSGQISRAAVNPAANEVSSVDEFVTGSSSQLDITTGPDGALYYIGHFSGTIKRLVPTAQEQKLVIYPTAIRVQEGGSALFSIRLAMQPEEPITLNILRQGGSAGSLYYDNITITFTPDNWNQPQSVVIKANVDANEVNDAAVFRVSGPGLNPEDVLVTEIDGELSTVPVTELLYRTGHSVPGESAETTFVSFSNPLADGDDVGFAAVIREDGKNKRAIFGTTSPSVIVREGDPAPGTPGAFQKFGDPLISGDRYCFAATLKTGGGVTKADDDGLWSNSAGDGLRLLAREGSEAPATNGARYQAFRSLALPADGAPLFIAKLKIGSGNAGSRVTKANDIALYREGGAGAEIVLRENDEIAIPGGETKPIKSFRALGYVKSSADQSRSFRRNGDVLVQVTFDDGTQAIVEARPEYLPEVIAYTGDAVQGFSETTLGTVGMPATGSGAVAFLSTLSRGDDITRKNDDAIFTLEAGASPAVLVREGDLAAQTDGATFAGFSEPAWAGESILVRATLKTGTGSPKTKGKTDTGLWSLTSSGAALIAREGALAPGTGNVFDKFLSYVGHPETSPTRAIAFTATTRKKGRAAKIRGLWGRDKEGSVFLLRQVGDVVSLGGGDSAKIATLHALEAKTQTAGNGRSVSANGHIVYRATLKKKMGQAIFRAQMP